MTQASAMGLLLALGLGLNQVWQLVATGAAYKAKVLCSGVFISKRNPQSVLGEDLEIEDLAPMRIIASGVDPAGKRAWAGVPGLIRQQAVYREGWGCTLVHEESGLVSDVQADAIVSTGNPPNPPFAKGGLTIAADLPQPLRNRLDAALDWAFAEPDPDHLRRTRAVVVMRDGRIVAERYAPGFGQHTALPGWSMAKSVMNALVGILVGQGRLDLAAPVAVPEWQGADDPRRAITLDQMMRMGSGLKFSEAAGEPLGDVTQMLLRQPDAGAYAARRDLEAKPGTLWHYASGTTNLISRLIRQVLGDAEYHAFPRRALFGPLGMSSAVLEADASGTFIGSSFLYATARDWARLGQLYLQDGVWEGRRILPQGWVAYSTRPTETGKHYGAHFWLDIQAEHQATDPEPPLPTDAFHAMGYEGQCVSIIPSQRLVVVRLGLARAASAWRQDRFVNRIVKEFTEHDKFASTTPQTALTVPLSNLLATKTKLEACEASGCYDLPMAHLKNWVGYTIQQVSRIFRR